MLGFRLIAVVLGCLMLTSMAEAKNGDNCGDLRKACQAAGFVQSGGHGSGTRVIRDCMDPLMNGVTPPGTGKLPLPKVSADAIASCKADKGKGGVTSAKSLPAQGARVGNPPVAVKALPTGQDPGPNIVMILVDDFSMNLMTDKAGVLSKGMPNLAQMMRDGVTFSNYFVTDSLCCPSRTSIFTGLMPHNSGVIANTGVNGGFGAFMAHKDDAKTFALALHNNYYATAMMGKYLNGYEPDQAGIPQGWSEWAVAGNAYANFNYAINHNAEMITPAPHMTDEMSTLGQAFIKGAAAGPFFLELATFSPHSPYVPPKRYADAFPGLTYPRTAAFDYRPDQYSPKWLQVIPALDKRFMNKIDEFYRLRVQSDMGVDDMIGAVRKTIDDLGLSKNTYIIFTSDNGYHMGEFSLRAGKMSPFDFDIHVPLVVVGPGVAAGQTIDDIAMNIDLYPTFTELAGIVPSATVDGHSLVPLLHGKPGPRRNIAVVEHAQSKPSPADPDAAEAKAGDPPDYVALRLGDAMYVEYNDGSKDVGYYDMTSDPDQLHNIAHTLSADRLKALHEALAANHACVGADACLAAQSMTP
ncbi:MAG: sulfatase [bacterium]